MAYHSCFFRHNGPSCILFLAGLPLKPLFGFLLCRLFFMQPLCPQWDAVLCVLLRDGIWNARALWQHAGLHVVGSCYFRCSLGAIITDHFCTEKRFHLKGPPPCETCCRCSSSACCAFLAVAMLQAPIWAESCTLAACLLQQVSRAGFHPTAVNAVRKSRAYVGSTFWAKFWATQLIL